MKKSSCSRTFAGRMFETPDVVYASTKFDKIPIGCLYLFQLSFATTGGRKWFFVGQNWRRSFHRFSPNLRVQILQSKKLAQTLLPLGRESARRFRCHQVRETVLFNLSFTETQMFDHVSKSKLILTHPIFLQVSVFLEISSSPTTQMMYVIHIWIHLQSCLDVCTAWRGPLRSFNDVTSFGKIRRPVVVRIRKAGSLFYEL